MKKVQIFAHLYNTHLTSRVSEQTWLRFKTNYKQTIVFRKKIHQKIEITCSIKGSIKNTLLTFDFNTL